MGMGGEGGVFSPQLYFFVIGVTLCKPGELSEPQFPRFKKKEMRFKSNPLLHACQGDCEDLKEEKKDGTLETKQH